MNTSDPNGATPPSYSAQCRTRAEDYLRKRGVLLETFTSHGGEIDHLLGWGQFCQRLKRGGGNGRCDPAWNEMESILWFKVPSFNGELAHYIARVIPNGSKGAKFLAPNGSDSLPWIPHETRAVARDAAVPLVLTEGPIKGMALLQAGAFPVAFVGVWMGAGTKKKANPDELEGDAGARDDGNAETLKLHSAIAENFKLWKRRIYVCFDADSSKNKNVRHGEIRIWLLLHGAGADVFQLSWPLPEGKGIDDYLAGRAETDAEKQREAFGALRENSVPFLETLDSHDIPMLTTELRRTRSESAVLEELTGKIARRLKVPRASLGNLTGTTRRDLGGAEEFKIPPTATPWDQELKPVDVLDQICEALMRFVWMKPSEYRAVALWIVLSYLHEVVNILPILLVTSPEEECGKSTLLELIYNLSNRPLGASNVSSAAIYRTIKDNCPTFIMTRRTPISKTMK